MIQWKKAGFEKGAVKFISGQMQMLIRSSAVLIMPQSETADFFNECDMMTTPVFAYSLYGLLRDKTQGRKIIYQYLSKEDAAWFLGFLKLDMNDESEITKIVFQDSDSKGNANEP